MRKYINQIKAIKTENDLKDAHIAICQATSNYELSWSNFLKLCEMLRQVRKEKGFKWGASI